MLLYWAIIYRVKSKHKELHKITKLVTLRNMVWNQKKGSEFYSGTWGGLNSNLEFKFKRISTTRALNQTRIQN